MKVASNAGKKSVMIATFKAHLKQKAIDTVNQYFTCIDILITTYVQMYMYIH